VVNLILWAVLVVIGWVFRDKYGRWPLAPMSDSVPVPALDAEETEILTMFRESRAADEAAAAAKRKQDFRKGVAGKLQVPSAPQ
jgi:hypothetical protein